MSVSEPRFAPNARVRLDIGVIFRQPMEWAGEDTYGLRLFSGVQRALQEGEHRALLVTRPSAELNLTEVPRQFAEHPVHGYVLDELLPDAFIRRLTETGRPAVVVNRECPVAGVGAVFRDNRGAGREAARQMLRRGHHVAACVYREDSNGREMAEGFLADMARSGAAVPESRRGGLDAGLSGFADLFARILAARPAPTTLCCTDDRIARTFYLWARDARLRIPRDIAVTGCIDLEMAARLDPPLSTVRFDPEAIGRTAVQRLIACCRDGHQAPDRKAVPGRWVERASLVKRRKAP